MNAWNIIQTCLVLEFIFQIQSWKNTNWKIDLIIKIFSFVILLLLWVEARRLTSSLPHREGSIRPGRRSGMSTKEFNLEFWEPCLVWFSFITENRLSQTWVPLNLGDSGQLLESCGAETLGSLLDQHPIALWFRNYSVWSAFTRPALTSKGNLTILVHSHRVWIQKDFGGIWSLIPQFG